MAPGRLAITPLLVLCIAHVQAAQTSSIVLTPDEKVVCAVNQDAASISLWNWSGDGRVRLVQVGQEPRTLAVSPDGREAYVANQSSQTLSIVDLTQAKTVKEIPLGGQPYGVLVSPDGQRVFVSQYAGGYMDGKYHTGIVAVVDLQAGMRVAQIPVKRRPWAMAMSDRAGSLYVTYYLNLDGEGLVTEIDPQQLRVVGEIRLREDDHVIDGEGGVFNALSSIALHPNGKRALVAGMHANVRRGLALNGQALSHKTTVQASVRVVDLQAGRELYDARIVSSFSGQAVAVPSAVAFLGSSEYFIDVYSGSNDFKVIRYNERGMVAERALRSLPPGPAGVAVTRDGRTAFFNNRWDRSISQFSLADIRNPTLVVTVRTCPEPWDKRRIQGAILFHNTRDTRMTANRWMSCGACHLEGGRVGDGLIWDLTVDKAEPKIGNTMDLVNTSVSSPPFFHRATPDVVDPLERFVQVFHQGSGFIITDEAPRDSGRPMEGRDRRSSMGILPMNPQGRLPMNPHGRDARATKWTAILAYIGDLRPRPNPHMEGDRPRPEVRAASERGRRLFFDPVVGCGRCHNGSSLTVSGRPGQPSLFDVGTGKEVKVPSLLNLWDTAPYLHDGRARALLEVLTTYNQGDRHGKTSHLNTRKLDDLVMFMLAPCVEEK